MHVRHLAILASALATITQGHALAQSVSLPQANYISEAEAGALYSSAPLVPTYQLGVGVGDYSNAATFFNATSNGAVSSNLSPSISTSASVSSNYSYLLAASASGFSYAFEVSGAPNVAIPVDITFGMKASAISQLIGSNSGATDLWFAVATGYPTSFYSSALSVGTPGEVTGNVLLSAFISDGTGCYYGSCTGGATNRISGVVSNASEGANLYLGGGSSMPIYTNLTELAYNGAQHITIQSNTLYSVTMMSYSTTTGNYVNTL